MVKKKAFPSPDRLDERQLRQRYAQTAEELWKKYFSMPPGDEARKVFKAAVEAESGEQFLDDDRD